MINSTRQHLKGRKGMSEKRRVKELFSTMSKKEKVKYLWEYYRYYLFGLIFVIAVTVFLVNEQSGQKEYALTIHVLADSVYSTEIEKIEQRLNEEILSEEERETHEVSIQVLPYSSNPADVTTVQATLQRLVAEISVGDLDVVFIDKNQYEIMNREEYFYNLNELIDGSLPVEEQFIFYDVNGQAVGIDSSGVPLFNQVIGGTEPVVMGVLRNTKREDKIKELFNVLFEK